MSACIYRVDPQEAMDLLSQEHLSILSFDTQEIMKRALMNSSRIWIGADDGGIVAVWGLIPPTLMSERAYLWLRTTKNFTKHTFLFIRHSQRAVQAMLEEYPLIIGHGTVGSECSLRWLRWLGARFGEPQGQFIPFTIEASQWPQQSERSA
jgi:hypothetical protein